MEPGTRKRVLVTGGTGFVGSHLVEELLKKGYAVRCLVRNLKKKRWLEGVEGIEFAEGGLDSPAVFRALKAVDYVVHLAGAVKASSRREFYRINTDATAGFVEKILSAGVKLKKFVFISSQAASGPTTYGLTKDEEQDDLPLSDYGLSKLKAEEYLASLGDRLPYVILRLSSVYGPRDTEILSLFRIIKHGIKPLFGTRDKKISLIYISEAARGIEKALSGAKPYQTYYISGAHPFTWEEIIGTIALALGREKLREVYLPEKAVKTLAFIWEKACGLFGRLPAFNSQKACELVCRNWALNTVKAAADFDFFSNFDINEGMKKTADWYRGNNLI